MSSLARQSLRNEPPKELCLVAALFRCITKKLVSTNRCVPCSHKRWSCQPWLFRNALGNAKVYRRLHWRILPTELPEALKFYLSNRGCEYKPQKNCLLAHKRAFSALLLLPNITSFSPGLSDNTWSTLGLQFLY